MSLHSLLYGQSNSIFIGGTSSAIHSPSVHFFGHQLLVFLHQDIRISATHEFADLATTWVADRLQADLTSMLLLIVVGALDVGSPVGILGCFDRHLFLLHSDVVNNKNTNSDFYQSWQQSAGYWLTDSFLSTSKW